MRIGRLAAVVLVAATAVACGGGFFRQYEYEEDIYLSLDGSARVYVNGSIPAIDALRGASFDVSPSARIDRRTIRDFYTTAVTRLTQQVRLSRRSSRRFVHVRLDVDDVRRLGEVAPFDWSTYRLDRDGDLYVYQQSIGRAANKSVGHVGWTGGEVVAFRLHLPSKIAYHNTLPGNVRRGNILLWEQSLEDRLHGVPLVLDARMESQSILYRTRWLFGATLVAVAATFGLVIWWILRRPPAGAPSEESP